MLRTAYQKNELTHKQRSAINMTEMTQIIIGVVGLAIALGAWLLPKRHRQTPAPVTKKPALNEDLPRALQKSSKEIEKIPADLTNIESTAKLNISGYEATVTIKEGAHPYRGGCVNSSYAKINVYILKGQILEVSISSSYVTLRIQSHIADQVAVKRTGYETKIKEI